MPGEHQMVEHGAVERLGGGRKTARRAAVAVAGASIAARMIVGDDDSRAAMRCGIGNDLADGEVGAGLVAVVRGNVETMRRIVDVSDPQALAPWILFRETAGEEIAGGSEAIELQREFG